MCLIAIYLIPIAKRKTMYSESSKIIMLLGFYFYIFFGTFRQISGNPLDTPSEDVSSYFDRIVGGVPAPIRVAPHVAGLVVGHQFPFMVCGGSIITEYHILTAAHCLDPFIEEGGNLQSSFHAVVGTNTWTSDGTVVTFAGFHKHPHWDHVYVKFDAGILILSNQLEFSHHIQPIELDYRWYGSNERTVVAGWGSHSPKGNASFALRFLEVRTITYRRCQREIRIAAEAARVELPRIDPEVEICTLREPGYGMCHGDSGSAVVSLESGRQFGIVSWGLPCAVGAPDVHTRVRGIADFIQAVLEITREEILIKNKE